MTQPTDDLAAEQVADFIRANDRSLVISASVIGEGGRGAIYHLASGMVFKLSAAECEALPAGYPKWRGIDCAD